MLVAFVYSPSNDVLDSLCPVPHALSYYSYDLPSVFVNGASRAFIVNAKSNQSQGQEPPLFNSCLMSRSRLGGSVLEAYKPPLLDHATSFAN